MEPSVLIPHVCRSPGLIAVNVAPSGGVIWLWSLSTPPQHNALPFAWSPHVCVSPALIAVNVLPAGGDDCFFSSLPQHAGVPSLFSAHA